MARFEFKFVRCSSYLKPIKDGRHMEQYVDGNGETTRVCYMENGKCLGESKSEGAYEFSKTYFERVEADFTGVMVGTKTVTVENWLYSDFDYDFRGCERIVLHKDKKTVIECGIVYYANNRKRYVPLVDIECQEVIGVARTLKLNQVFQNGDNEGKKSEEEFSKWKDKALKEMEAEMKRALEW